MCHFMTDKERIYLYLNGQLSRRSFRKWLLSSDSLTSIFKEDATILKKLADKFSLTSKIREIIEKHIDKGDFNKFTIRTTIQDLKDSTSDPIEIIYALSSVNDIINNESLNMDIRRLRSLVGSMPTLKQQHLWNKEAFLQKRLPLTNLEPEIFRVFQDTLSYSLDNTNGT